MKLIIVYVYLKTLEFHYQVQVLTAHWACVVLGI